MLDKKDTTLIKLDCKSKDKVYDMLFGKADACLKNAKTVALLYLGSPYYMTRALEEYNIEEVNIFTTKDFKFIYEPFENAERVKIWYVDNVKDTFKECDMKFDCIIMNPPYNRGLHIKILDEAIKHIKNTGNVISLQPIVKWQESLLFDSDLPVENTCVLDRYTMDESSKLFNSHQRCDLGLVSIGKTSCTLVDNIGTLQKMKTKLKKAISAAGLLVDKLEDDYKDFPVNFGYGVTIAGNGGHGKACYRLTGTDEAKATRREEIGHCARYNAKDKVEQHLIHSFYTNQLIRFIAKEFGFGGIPYKILPFAAGFIDENGKTPIDEEWSFEKLAKWFELNYNDLVVVRKSLDAYLHPEEQKVIEDTMEKYK